MTDIQAIRKLICPKEKWVNDKDITNCHSCQKQFRPLIRWKHHCRFCGRVFCSNCCRFVIWGEQINYKQQKKLRNCEQCHLKIQSVSKTQNNNYVRKSQLVDADQPLINIEIDDIEITSQNSTNQFKRSLDEQICLKLINMSQKLCQKLELEEATWSKRLAILAWQTVIEVNFQTFICKEFFNLLKEVRIVMIKTPKDAVTAVCVKGLILQRNIPSKQLQMHLKFPKILTIKPAIQADGLIKNNQVRFDEMIKNENIILKNYLQKIFRLKPNVIFVEEHVSKVAFEYFLQHKIMVMSKMKSSDMDAIQKLALIRKRIDNLLLVERYKINDMLGVCDRIYFKSINTGQMLMFVEHEAGIRSVLLGDFSQEINYNLKKVFQILLKMAWNLRKQRQIIIRDDKIQQNLIYAINVNFYNKLNTQKYSSYQSFINSQQINCTKIKYKHRKIGQLSKNFNQYCLRMNRANYYQTCETKFIKLKLYAGEQSFLGGHLLQYIISTDVRCQKCQCIHAERYFINDYCLTITIQNYAQRNGSFFNANSHELQQEQEKIQEKESIEHYKTIIKYFKNYKQKLYFKQFFKCQDCGQIIGNSKVKIGKEYLSISFMHFLSQLVQNYKNSQLIANEKRKRKGEECQHASIVRIIQCPRTLIKFYIQKIDKYQISPIILNEANWQLVQNKDEKMIRDLYNFQFAQKSMCIDCIQNDMMKLPFYLSGNSSTYSFSSVSMSAKAQHYISYFDKIMDILMKLRENLIQIEKSIQKYFEQIMHDWTVVMRKLYKIEHVLKIIIEVNNFISNALRKQKIEESNYSNFEDNVILTEPSLSPQERQSRVRKYSEQRSQNESLIKQSIASSHISLRKDTSIEIQSEVDAFVKKLRKQRFVRYQGVYMYFPIGNIYDPVSILACCLNSQQFYAYLKQQKIRDQIIFKMPFSKQLKTEWFLNQQIENIYKELYRQDFDKNQTFEFQFSIYYHKQFQQLRLNQGINFKLFVRSLYGCQNWDSSGGKSSSTFSKSHNQLLVVKIINEKQFIQFQKFAPEYLKYMKYKREKGQTSYLAKIYGIYQANIRNKIYKFVVMQNIFFGMTGSMKVYDLKGSQLNRLTMPNHEKSFTGLDTNFLIDKDGKPYLLQSSIYQKLMKILQEDAIFLKDQSVIDYSLLVIESQFQLRMGIIDFMRPYHLIEKIETIYKEIKSGKDPTVIPPQQYAERFTNAMHKYFSKV